MSDRVFSLRFSEEEMDALDWLVRAEGFASRGDCLRLLVLQRVIHLCPEGPILAAARSARLGRRVRRAREVIAREENGGPVGPSA